MDKKTRAILRGRIADSLSRIAKRKVKDGLWGNIKAKANDIKNDVVNVGRTVKNYTYSNSEDAVNQIINYVEKHPDAKLRIQGAAKVGNNMASATLLVNKGKYMIMATESKKKLNKGAVDELLFGLEEVGFQGKSKRKKPQQEETSEGQQGQQQGQGQSEGQTGQDQGNNSGQGN